MTRKQFVLSQGATCCNPRAWSFRNEQKRFVIFGTSDKRTKGNETTILSENWKKNPNGRKRPGYKEAREHIRLIEEEAYQLMTVPTKRVKRKGGKESFRLRDRSPQLVPKRLRKRTKYGKMEWYVTNSSDDKHLRLPEELPTADKYLEGARLTVTINAYERNPKARDACVAHHGCKCKVCGFDFGAVYGDFGKGFIHVHHLKPIGHIGTRYEVNPAEDLVPVCPNCHAMLHHIEPPLTIQKLQHILKAVSKT